MSSASMMPLLLSLSLHAILDGFLLWEASQQIWLGIFLHELPLALILGVALRQAHPKATLKNFIILGIFAASMPTGYMLHNFLKGTLAATDIHRLSAVVVGGLCNMAATILANADPNSRITNFILLTTGAAAAYGMHHMGC